MTKKEKVHSKIILLTEFYNEFNRWPKQREKYKSINIGCFITNIRAKKISISNDDMVLLKSMNFSFNPKRNQVHYKVLLLIEFYNKFNRWPKATEVYKNKFIGYFCRNIRYKSTTLSESDKKLLSNLGFNFNVSFKKEEIHNKVLILIEFYNKFNKWPKTKETYKGVNIGSFSKSIKSKNTSISNDDAILLKNLGFNFDFISKKDQVHNKVMLLVEFYNTFNRWPITRETYKGVNIGAFAQSIRSKKTSISDDDTIFLKNIGFIFDCISKKESVHNKVLLLVEFYNTFNRWPKLREVYKNVNIGRFVSGIRFNGTSLSNEDAKLLKNLGFNFGSIKKSDYKI